jgi:hypothetical protein
MARSPLGLIRAVNLDLTTVDISGIAIDTGAEPLTRWAGTGDLNHASIGNGVDNRAIRGFANIARGIEYHGEGTVAIAIAGSGANELQHVDRRWGLGVVGRSFGGDEPRSGATVGGGGDRFSIQAVAKFDIECFWGQPNCTDIQLHRLSSRRYA